MCKQESTRVNYLSTKCVDKWVVLKGTEGTKGTEETRTTSDLMVAAVDDDGEDGDVSGVNSGDARSLGKGFGAMLLQFLTAFKA